MDTEYDFLDKKRIVFLGDSITDDGTFIAHIRYHLFKYMGIKNIELINLGVNSETTSGFSEPEHPFQRPCIHDRLDRALGICKPEWVVICYGMNDGGYYPNSDQRFLAYKAGMIKLIKRVKDYNAKVMVMTPPPFDANSFKGELFPKGLEQYSYEKPYEQYTKVLKEYGKWILTDLRNECDEVVDIYSPLIEHIQAERKNNPDYSYGEGIHPAMDGHWIIARELMNKLFRICLERKPKYLNNPETDSIFKLIEKQHRILSSAWKEYIGHTNPNKVESLPIETAKAIADDIWSEMYTIKANIDNPTYDVTCEWKGYQRHDFYVNGREAIFIEPKEYATGNPWIWRTEFFDSFSYADMAMLKQGYGLAYYRISHLYGCPKAVRMMYGFYDILIKKFELKKKTVLFGFSRGGLYACNFTAEYPDAIACLYLDAPVLDIKSWPGGGKEMGQGARNEWEECLNVYGLNESTVLNYEGNPLNKINYFVEKGIPIILVAGDSDEVVPLIENGLILAKRYQVLNGEIKVIIKQGVGHHPHSLENPEEIVEFIINH
jgi:lysophospholipase L1-like esterase/predicted esterase